MEQEQNTATATHAARSTGGQQQRPPQQQQRDVAQAWTALVAKPSALTDIAATVRDRYGNETADAISDLFDALMRSNTDSD